MWSYYGAKTNVVKFYPKPKYSKIIEPFAGTARYALQYFENDVLLVDKYEVVVRIWQWLQQCSPADVLRLPRRLKPGETLNDFTFDCDEERWLMGFLIKKAVERPRLTPTKWVTIDRPNFTNFSLQRIANNLHKIRHWKIEQGSYSDVPNQQATWFVDPPYQYGGHSYVHSSKKLNFQELGVWCESRQGQVIVCETEKANWLDFVPLMKHKARKGWQHEAIWTNEPTAYNNVQSSFF